MIYAFAILTVPVPSLRPPGIKSERLEYLQVGNLIAAIEPDVDVRELEQLPENLLMEAILKHDQAIRQLFEHRTLLPLRFGTAFVSLELLQQYLHSHSTQLSDRLTQLQGYAEYAIKGSFAYQPLEPPQALKGRDYLLAKRNLYLQQQQMRLLQQQEYINLSELLTSLDWDIPNPQLAASQPPEDFKAFILMTPAQAQNLTSRLEQWQSSHTCWQLEMSVALPPYHYSGE